MVSKGFPEKQMLSWAESGCNRPPGWRKERPSRQREQHMQRAQGKRKPIMFSGRLGACVGRREEY